jgi:hypothetical protein
MRQGTPHAMALPYIPPICLNLLHDFIIAYKKADLTSQ